MTGKKKPVRRGYGNVLCYWFWTLPWCRGQPNDALPDYLAAHPLATKSNVASLNIIEVSVVAVKKSLKEHFTNIPVGEDNKTKIFLHLGVHGGATCFNLEDTAWNEADFRCADEQGLVLTEDPIKRKNEPSHSYKTSLPIQEIYERVCEKGFSCVISHDAGRFLCNYIYYLSLHKSQANGTHSLFVHVPPFEQIGKEEQLAFVKALIEIITECLCSETA